MVVGIILATLGTALAGFGAGNLLGGGGGGTFGNKLISFGSDETLITKKNQTINAPFNFTQFAPTTVTETTTIIDSPNTNFSSKKDTGGASATPSFIISPSQADSFGSGGSGSNPFASSGIGGLLLIGGVGFVAYSIFTGGKKK